MRYMNLPSGMRRFDVSGERIRRRWVGRDFQLIIECAIPNPNVDYIQIGTSCARGTDTDEDREREMGKNTIRRLTD